MSDVKITKCTVDPYFEKNIGQLPSEIKYKINSNGYTTFFTDNKIVVSLPSNIEETINVFNMKLENTNSDIEIKGEEKQIGIVNYFIGENKSQWITDIPTYSKIKYKEVYENIDLYYYINNYNLEYDFVLSKGANPKDISISFEGLDNIEIDEEQNLVLLIGDVCAKLLKPEVYQIINDEKINVACEYILGENDCINFLISDYEKEYDLVLDPVLALDYSTYIGGTGNDFSYGIAVDGAGNVYTTGKIYSTNYPVTTGAYQTAFGGSSDAFVTKLSRDGKTLIYSTYLGGTGSDYGNRIAVDGIGGAYVVGATTGSFPVTSGAYQTTFGGNYDVFVSKLSQYGNSLLYSTYLGGTNIDYGNDIVVDDLGYAYITGETKSTNFPTTTEAYKTTPLGMDNVFVTKLSKDGKTLIYSTYIGGELIDLGNAIAIDEHGYAYVTGETQSSDFPTTTGAYQTTIRGSSNAFITKLNTDGSKLIYSTYLGGRDFAYGKGIAVDSQGCAYIAGYTTYTDFPTTDKAYQKTSNGKEEIFITKLSKNGNSLIYSTYLGGSGYDAAYGIAIDNQGCAYVTGYTMSTNFPITSGAYQTTFKGEGSAGDTFVSKLSTDGSELMYSTYLGGSSYEYGNAIAVDNRGAIYISGSTSSSNYPITSNAYQTTNKGANDTFVSKLTPVEIDLTWKYTPTQAKLLDIITANLSINNLSSTNIDIAIRYNYIDSSVSYIPSSLKIQNINQSLDTIPQEIYISNIPACENAEISIDLKYIKEVFPQKIPIIVETDIYYNKSGTMTLVDSIEKPFYLNIGLGPNYIPGCKIMYNLVIDGKLQTTSSGVPIVYYKSGTSYIYIEPNLNKYVYKVLSNLSNVVEHPINI